MSFFKKIFCYLSVLILIVLVVPSTNSRGIPETFSELAEELLPSVVNISTTQLIEDKYNTRPQFQFPPGSPFEDMFRDFFDMNDFTLVDTPIFTPNSAEGTSTLFETKYFDTKAYLCQTGQLYGEASAMAFSRHYNFGPCFRAEKSKTRRHLTEFWMVEPEIAYCDINEIKNSYNIVIIIINKFTN